MMKRCNRLQWIVYPKKRERIQILMIQSKYTEKRIVQTGTISNKIGKPFFVKENLNWYFYLFEIVLYLSWFGYFQVQVSSIVNLFSNCIILKFQTITISQIIILAVT